MSKSFLEVIETFRAKLSYAIPALIAAHDEELSSLKEELESSHKDKLSKQREAHATEVAKLKKELEEAKRLHEAEVAKLKKERDERLDLIVAEHRASQNGKTYEEYSSNPYQTRYTYNKW